MSSAGCSLIYTMLLCKLNFKKIVFLEMIFEGHTRVRIQLQLVSHVSVKLAVTCSINVILYPFCFACSSLNMQCLPSAVGLSLRQTWVNS